MSLTTPESIGRLQRKLYCKAKAEPGFRFYLLYDKICREDMLVACLEALPCQRGSAGSGRGELRGDRGRRAGGVARGTADGARREDVPSGTGATGADPEARRWRARARHPDDPGPGGADCRQAGAGTDLRGGLRGQRVWLPAPAGRARRDQGGASLRAARLHRCGGCRSVEVLRHHSAPGTDGVGGPTHR